MIIWREFTIDRLQHAPQMTSHYFEQIDWKALDHNDMTLWQKGEEYLKETQSQLVALFVGTNRRHFRKRCG
jgi:hypothetical protein